MNTTQHDKKALDTLKNLAKIDPDKATYFTHTKADGSESKQLNRYPEVTYDLNYLLEEDMPGIFHSSFDVANFKFTNRMDEFAVVDPGKQVLFVDVGEPALCGREYLDAALERAEVGWQDAEVFITHAHDDHDGNVRYCLERGAKRVYKGDLPEYSPALIQEFMVATGMERLCSAEDMPFYIEFMLNRDYLFDGFEDRVVVVKSGDEITVGGYTFEALETPGHTVDHLCLIDRARGILFAGDHIIDSPPGLMQFFANTHLVKRFLESLAYLKTLGLTHVFMCHRDALEGTEEINAFIQNIIDSYERPVEKMAAQLEEEPLTIYELAQKYYAYLESWEEQPPILMVRRVAIAWGYLEYLADTGRATCTTAAHGSLIYKKAGEGPA